MESKSEAIKILNEILKAEKNCTKQIAFEILKAKSDSKKISGLNYDENSENDKNVSISISRLSSKKNTSLPSFASESDLNLSSSSKNLKDGEKEFLSEIEKTQENDSTENLNHKKKKLNRFPNFKKREKKKTIYRFRC